MDGKLRIWQITMESFDSTKAETAFTNQISHTESPIVDISASVSPNSQANKQLFLIAACSMDGLIRFFYFLFFYVFIFYFFIFFSNFVFFC